MAVSFIQVLQTPVVILWLFQLFGAGEAFNVALRTQRYVQRGGHIIMKCDFDIDFDEVYKIEWHWSQRRIFQYYKGRKPPFRPSSNNFQGGTIDMKHSSEKQIKIKNVDFNATGAYSCSVSTEKPIYTKASDNVIVTVFEPQRGNPRISLRKESYSIGEVLQLNCTSAPARPPPAVVWLLNGKEVEYEKLKSFPLERHQHVSGEHLCTSTTQLTLDISEIHVGPNGVIELTCLSTIPAYLDDDDEGYVDKRIENISIEVHKAQPVMEETNSSSTRNHAPFLLIFICFFIKGT